jgi:hypothetical protein
MISSLSLDFFVHTTISAIQSYPRTVHATSCSLMSSTIPTAGVPSLLVSISAIMWHSGNVDTST